jgi:hypothetical protein
VIGEAKTSFILNIDVTLSLILKSPTAPLSLDKVAMLVLG